MKERPKLKRFSQIVIQALVINQNPKLYGELEKYFADLGHEPSDYDLLAYAEVTLTLDGEFPPYERKHGDPDNVVDHVSAFIEDMHAETFS